MKNKINRKGGGAKATNKISGNGSLKGFKGNLGQNKNRSKSSKSNSLKEQWNLVPIGEEFHTDKEFENLVSFEELVDYNVVKMDDGTAEILSKEAGNPSKRSNKRKTTDEEILSDDADDGDDSCKKTRLPSSEEQSKKKSSKNKASTKDTEVFNTSAGLVVVEDEIITVEHENKRVQKQPCDINPPSKKKKTSRDEGTTRKKAVKKPQTFTTIEAVVVEDTIDENEDFEEQEWVKLGVPDIVVKSLREKNFNRPTTIQILTLPAAILGKKDVVGAAETGSGKTLAFVIPIIDGILKTREKDLQASDEEDYSLSALILTPTRELAVQIKNHFDVAAKHCRAKSVVIVGGLASQKQERLLRSHPDVVIATPGRLWELIREGDPYLSTLGQIRFLAIDETDRMVERGHFRELQSILEIINRDEVHKANRQNFVFSATLAFTHEPPQRLKKIGNRTVKQQPKKLSTKEKLKQISEMVGLRPNPKIVDITTSKGTCETLTELQISCSQNQKDYYLYYFLLCHPGRTIVFCNSINCVRRLTNLFFLLQCGEVLPLHSEMHQKMRLRNLEKFTANEKGILMATDVAARGLDIKNIEHVIHYQVPKTAESYIHRSGRTARAFKGGIAILMVEPSETTLVKNIFRSLERDEMLPNFDVNGKIFREIKSRVEMAVKVETFEHSVRKKLADHNWMEKSKKEMDLASSEDDTDDEDSGSVKQKKMLMQAKKKLESYKQQLAQMISDNLFLMKKNNQ